MKDKKIRQALASVKLAKVEDGRKVRQVYCKAYNKALRQANKQACQE